MNPFVVLAGCLLLAGILSLFQPKQNSILSKARWAGKREKINAWRKAYAQHKNPKVGSTSLFLGKVPEKPWLEELNILINNKSSVIPFANMQGSGLVFGSPDAGKTTTINNNFIRNILKYGKGPLIVFDPKGDLTEANAPYAEACGYKTYFLAPGKPYTDCLNIFSFFKGRESMRTSVADKAAASTIANTKSEDTGKSDGFFGPSGRALVRSGLMLTEESAYQDLVFLRELLCAENLGGRIQHAEQQGEISWQTANSFRQFISGKAAEKTLSGIQATASLVFDNFVREEFFNAFIRESTIPIDLKGKQVVFIQPVKGFEDVCMPVMASIMELYVERNFSGQREDPLHILVDEAHLFRLSCVAKSLALLRSSGLVMVLLTQSMSQLRQMYGQDNLNTILNSARTKIFLNPDDLEIARWVSEKAGKVDVVYKQSSRSFGKGGGRSSSEQRQQVPLVSPEEVNQMKQGEMIYWNSANANPKKDGYPVMVRYKVPQSDLDLEERCKVFWKQRMLPRVIKERQKQHYDSVQIEQFVKQRVRAIDRLYPDPNNKKEEEENAPLLEKKEPETAGIVKNETKFSAYI